MAARETRMTMVRREKERKKEGKPAVAVEGRGGPQRAFRHAVEIGATRPISIAILQLDFVASQ